MTEKWLLIAFDSTQQALRAEMLLEYADIEIDTCPTPKSITADPDLFDSALELFDLDRISYCELILKDDKKARNHVFYQALSPKPDG